MCGKMSKPPWLGDRFPFVPNRRSVDLKKLEKFFQGAEPRGVKPYIVVPKQGQSYATGSVVPLLGLIRAPYRTAGGIVLPDHDRAQALPYMKSYVTLEEYLAPDLKQKGHDYDAGEVVRLLLKQHSRQDLLLHLAYLNHIVDRPTQTAEQLEDYRVRMPRAWIEHFDQALNRDGMPRAFLARQPILRAMRTAVLEGTDSASPSWPQAPIDAAIMLTHAIAGQLNAGLQGEGQELWPSVPSAIAMEVVQNYLFHEAEDTWARLTRYDHLWSHYGPTLKRYGGKLRKHPDELFRDAAAIDRKDFIALGFSLWVRSNNSNPGPHDPFADLGMDRKAIEGALELLAVDMNTLAERLAAGKSDWAMLPFETTPVLRLSDNSVVVLDETLLLDRITKGLYWIVFDAELNQGGKASELWSAAYSEMIELYAEDRIAAMAPKVLGEKTFYTEDDIGAAYGERRCDAIIDVGEFGLFEIQKGQLSIATRQQGDIEKFKTETDQMIIQKTQQLDETAKAVLEDERSLTGHKPRIQPRVQPVVVLGGSYPVNPITTEYIEQQVAKAKLLTDARIRALGVIDLGELDMLEGLFEHEHSNPVAVVEEWKKSSTWRFSLRNYLWEQRRTGDPDQFRPAWMRAAGEGLFDEVITRLKPTQDDGATEITR
jgi:hypothetical protein